MSKKTKNLIIVAGPTAVGKTDLCLNLAKKFNTSIVSADSRQFFIEMNIGTAKPSQEQLHQVRHYFINSLSIKEDYDVRRFEKEALSVLERLFMRHDLVILTGGSGLYLDAVAHGFDDIPDVDASLREELNLLFAKKGIGALQEELRNLDPVYYSEVDLNNPQRIIRALEVTKGTGRPYSSYRTRKIVDRPFKVIKIALAREREELYARIDARMDQMVGEGLFEEAEALFPFRHLNALQTVGYKEIFGYLAGEYDKAEAIRLLKRNSRRYAKRQMTWFRRDNTYRWFHPSQADLIVNFVRNQTG